MPGISIRSIAHRVPETVVTNDDVIAMLRERNAGRFEPAVLDSMEKHVRLGFAIAGTTTRHIAGEDETSFSMLLEAAREALQAAETDPAEVDLIIYAGVARGWLEPAMAAAVQDGLGAVNATCFDVLDACASWLRGVHVARSQILSGAYRNALVVNCESGMRDFVELEMPEPQALAHYFAALTLGEAATATFVSAADGDDFRFLFRTFAGGHRLCRTPLSNIAMFDRDDPIALGNPGKFFAHSTELVSATVRHFVETFKGSPEFSGATYDVAFSHAASMKAVEVLARRLGIPFDIYVPTHADYGNTSSASVPLAMSLALEDGRLARGKRVLIGVGSAGITVGLARFTY